jgi:hypothetical protein
MTELKVMGLLGIVLIWGALIAEIRRDWKDWHR